MLSSSSPVSLSAHKDVLEATIPEDSSQRASLLEELKRRGKGAVVAQRWPDAVALYTKSLEVAVTDGEMAILNANLALANGKMGKWKESNESCQEAVRLDPTYVKGWWRLGQAHTAQGNHTQAIAALNKALLLEPENKALLKEIEKTKVAQQKAEEAPPPSATTKPKVEKAEPLKKTTTTTTKQEEDTTTKTTPGDDEAQFSASDHVKGYKVVNGKKTSYFHNELTEDAAKLIGDIAPKKLQETAPTPAPPTNGVSAWNKAGTWEEKDCTKWAKESLEKSLLATQAGEWNVTKAEVGSGHASVAMVRGKKRFIYEMENVVLDWNYQDGDATGKIHVAGFDGTDSEYEFIEFHVTTQSDEEGGELGKRLKRPASQTALRGGIQQSIGAWVKLFQETF